MHGNNENAAGRIKIKMSDQNDSADNFFSASSSVKFSRARRTAIPTTSGQA
jgi:hypothetical protein